MVIAKFQIGLRRLLPFVALLGLVHGRTAEGEIKLSPGQVPIGDNELNSAVNEPQVTIQENSSNAVMRPVPPEIQQSTDPLIKLVYETREAQRRRLLSTAENTPWQIMHGMLALREDFLIRHNDQPVNCLEWIQSGAQFEGENWFEKTTVRVSTGRGSNQAFDMMTVGRGHPYNKPYAFEGHINQFVAILSMSGLPLESQFQTAQGPVSMRDMLTYAKLTVNEKEEVTWTLWALSRYLPPDAEWLNAKGERWSIERLVKIEVEKQLQGAPCGGTHGLFALAHARNVYMRSGRPLVGVWLEAEHKIRRYIETARLQQNSNGTLSSNYFRGREYKQDFDKRMASSGHLLEFLMMALPSREINDPWVRRAIEATTNDLMANRRSFVSCSPLYHCTSALSIYLDRVAAPAPNIAQGAPKTQTISSSREIATTDKAVDYSEAVKCPVLESSGVDANGAPNVLTGPTVIEPAAPEQPASAETMPGEATPAEAGPADPALSPENSTPPIPLNVPVVNHLIIVQPRTQLEAPPAILAASAPHLTQVVSDPKIRVFGPQPSDTETSTGPFHIVSGSAGSAPVLSRQTTAANPMTLVASTRFLPSDKPAARQPERRDSLPGQKKTPSWKATLLERRKVIIVEERLPGI